VEYFKCFSCRVSKVSECTSEMKPWIAVAKAAFQQEEDFLSGIRA
jgi:hypothetical protein